MKMVSINYRYKNRYQLLFLKLKSYILTAVPDSSLGFGGGVPLPARTLKLTNPEYIVSFHILLSQWHGNNVEIQTYH